MSTCLSALNADILDLLCDAVRTTGLDALKTLSVTSRQMRAAALSRMFSAVRVEGTMRECTEVMREILRAQGLVGFIRKFTLKLDVTEDVIEDVNIHKDPANSAARLAVSPTAVAFSAALIALLSQTVTMRGLQSLTIGDPEPAIASSESILNYNLKSMSAAVRLDSVVELSTLSGCTVLAAICPSVTRLSLTDRPSSEQAKMWGTQTRVECLTVKGIRDLESIQAMTQSMQHLTELTVKDGMDIRTELPRLSHLESLRVLTLGYLFQLELGYHPPQCGFGWGQLRRDPSRMENLRAQRGRALNEAKRLARSVFPRLEKLHIDGVTFDFSWLKTGDLDELNALEVDSE